MHVCHGPVKIILYKYAMTIRKTVSLQGHGVQSLASLETLHKQGFTSLSSSWGITMNQKMDEIWAAVSHIPRDTERLPIEILFLYPIKPSSLFYNI